LATFASVITAAGFVSAGFELSALGVYPVADWFASESVNGIGLSRRSATLGHRRKDRPNLIEGMRKRGGDNPESIMAQFEEAQGNGPSASTPPAATRRRWAS
jgi:hypothetical protein